MSRSAALLLLIIGGILQGGYFAIAKYLTLSGVPPLGAVWWQALGGSILFALLCASTGNRPKFTTSQLPYHIAISLTYVIVPNVVVFVTASHLPTGIISLLGALSPTCTYLGALLFRMERIDLFRILGVLLGLFGTVILFSPRTDFGSEIPFLWCALGLLLPVSFAASNILRQKHWPVGESARTLACAMMVVSTVLLIPVCVLTSSFYFPSEMRSPVTASLALYVLCATIYVWIAFRIVQIAGAVYISQIGYVVALSGVVFGYFFYNEIPNEGVAIAALCILAGLGLVTRRQRFAAPNR